MRALITGHRGFVGRHLAAALQRRGDEVTGVDLADGDDALDFFRDPWAHDFDLAVHCAAHIGGRAGIDGTPLAVATNLALDSWFFRWLQQSGTPAAVYFSSSASYPVDLQNDLARPHRLREGDGYRTKTGETIVTSSGMLAGQLQEVAQKMGQSATAYQRAVDTQAEIEGRAIRRRNPCYDVFLRTTRNPLWTHVGYESYAGQAHSVRVPNGIIYVRRNGKAIWSCA